MTICLAAMCKRSSSDHVVVVAADRMVTLGSMTEFEHAVPKVTRLAHGVVALVAGDALTGAELVREAKEPFDTPVKVEVVVNRLRTGYANLRRQRMEAEVLALHGLSLAEFLSRHGSLKLEIAGVIDQQMTQFSLGVELLVAGVDEGGAHLISIQNPGGTSRDHGVIGYVAVGSCAFHAIHSMIGFGHTPGSAYEETVFRVFAAKRRAEAAPGVGHELDLFIVDTAGCHRVGVDSLRHLDRLHDKYLRAIAGFSRQLGRLEVLCERVDADLA